MTKNVCLRIGIILIISILLFALLLFYIKRPDEVSYANTTGQFNSESPVLIIDAGHGGEDGGALSANDVSESGINLSIALKTNAIMGLFGSETVMTRTEDISLHSEGSKTLRQKKVSDLKNRLKLINSVKDGILISIHQNSFTDSYYHGAQVFYPGNDEKSEEFAKLTQEIMRTTLDPENDRKAAKVSESVFLMNNIKCTAILIESGFMTNSKEAKLLQTNDYQNRIAAAAAASFYQFVRSDYYSEGT